MTIYGWDTVPVDTTMPASGQTVNGTPFSVPRGTYAATFYIPDLVGAATTCKLQALVPNTDQAAEVWLDLKTFDFSATAPTVPIALDELPEATATTIPGSALAGGVFRLVASVDQSSVPVRIPVGFVVTR